MQACCGRNSGNPATTGDVLVMPLDFNLMLDINAIKVYGGIHIMQSGSIKFEETWPICSALHINEINFSVKFDEKQGMWVTACKWSAGWAPEKLRNRISEYLLSC